jgi:acetyltransferase-like isoleucine patch superfamily enzyme
MSWFGSRLSRKPKVDKTSVDQTANFRAIPSQHAFGTGETLPAPERLDRSDLRYGAACHVWSEFRKNARIADDALLGLSACAVNLSGQIHNIAVGSRSVVRGIIRVEATGAVHIGDHSYIGDDSIISSRLRVDIGSDVLIAHNCQIFDNTTHPLSARERALHYRAILAGESYNGEIPSSAISISDGVWVGMHSLIMRGVCIGAKSIIAAGAVVLHDVETLTTVGGNPARPLGKADA